MKLTGVQFVHSLKIYDFDQADFELKLGDRVLVETTQGQEIGRVVYINKSSRKGGQEIKPILRKATEEDLAKWQSLKEEAKKHLPEFERQIKKFGLKMSAIAADISIDEKRLTFYFTSENRVDFRDLVRELASNSRRQIRLLQIGSRDAARILGGYGRCGREVCCHRFLTDLESITMDMAREQNIATKSGSKISGICGRLMCCLAYEIEDKNKIEAEIKKQIS